MRPDRILFLATLIACASSIAFAWPFQRDYRAERVVYAQPGGEKLWMTVYQPREESAKARPAVALFHGGAWIVGTRHQVSWYARHLAEHGYVAATVSYRKLPKHGFPESVYDAKAAVRWLRTNAARYHIDPDRIAASGHSAGGHLAMMLGVTGKNGRFAGDVGDDAVSSHVSAVISVYGAVDLTVYEKDSEQVHLEGISRKLLEQFVKSVDEKGVDAFAVASPITYIDQDSAPTLFLQGSEDWLVPPIASARAKRKLDDAGVPARRVLVEGVGHSFDYLAPRRRPMVLDEMLLFLARHLEPTHGNQS